jgi:hypothetical protein
MEENQLEESDGANAMPTVEEREGNVTTYKYSINFKLSFK